jgi:hypothetical protein
VEAAFIVLLFAGGNKEVKPHGFCADSPFAFMDFGVQRVFIISAVLNANLQS